MELFFSNMLSAARQVGTLFIIVAVGFLCDRLKIFTEKTAKACTNLLFYVVTPVVIVRSFMSMEFNAANMKGFLTALACGAAVHVCGIVLSLPFFNKHPDEVGSVYKFSTTFGNMGYMCLPLAQSILGPEGVFYCSAGVVAYNIFAFTYGSWLMSRKKSGYKFKLRSLVLNPGVLSVLIGVPLFIFSVRLPSVLDAATKHIENMNSPLPMLLLGTYISNADLKHMFVKREHYLILLLKQICMPLILITAYRLCGMSGALLTACGISCSAPTATNTVMFAAKYDKDTSAASEVVAFGTLLSILTMPFMIAYTMTG